jgi:thymidylate synthase
MHISYRNVNHAFKDLVLTFRNALTRGDTNQTVLTKSSRYGDVYMIDEPLIITYERPIERVLMNKKRDPNPFFLLYEALWMLAGYQRVEGLAYYNKRMLEFSDDGKKLTGSAYGYRWRSRNWSMGEPHSGPSPFIKVDQLTALVEHLQESPNSRRAVLQMWTVEEDLHGLFKKSKDLCCNTHVYFNQVMAKCFSCLGAKVLADGITPCEVCKGSGEAPLELNMTVCNRSNDLILGTLNSDYMCFSILLEYMAARLGVEPGLFHLFTNNLHVYKDAWNPDLWLREYEETPSLVDWYHKTDWVRVPLVKNPDAFDEEVKRLVARHSKDALADDNMYTEPFLRDVAQPMFIAFHQYKRGEKLDALRAAESIQASDWRRSCQQWLMNRIYKKPSGVK